MRSALRWFLRSGKLEAVIQEVRESSDVIEEFPGRGSEPVRTGINASVSACSNARKCLL